MYYFTISPEIDSSISMLCRDLASDERYNNFIKTFSRMVDFCNKVRTTIWSASEIKLFYKDFNSFYTDYARISIFMQNDAAVSVLPFMQDVNNMLLNIIIRVVPSSAAIGIEVIKLVSSVHYKGRGFSRDFDDESSYLVFCLNNFKKNGLTFKTGKNKSVLEYMFFCADKKAFLSLVAAGMIDASSLVYVEEVYRNMTDEDEDGHFEQVYTDMLDATNYIS